MKQIQNPKTKIKKADDSGAVIDGEFLRYSDIVSRALNQRVPEGGLAPKQVKRRIELIDKVDSFADKDRVIIEDAEHSEIWKLLEEPGWGVQRDVAEMLAAWENPEVYEIEGEDKSKQPDEDPVANG